MQILYCKGNIKRPYPTYGKPLKLSCRFLWCFKATFTQETAC